MDKNGFKLWWEFEGKVHPVLGRIQLSMRK